MALSGLDIYKLLPKTNCKDCGFSTCLAFAMALAQKKSSLDKCPHVSAESRQSLESASQPPVKLVTIGAGEGRVEIGNETVMYRHEQKFYHPAAIGFLLDDSLDEEEIRKAVSRINSLKFERVGQAIGPDLICIKNASGYRNKFLRAVSITEASSGMALALCSGDAASTAEALKICANKRPLIICEDSDKAGDFIALAVQNKVPIALTCSSIEEASDATARAKALGADEIVINLKGMKTARRIQSFTYMRRSALKKNFRPLGYPVMVFAESGDGYTELADAVSYVAKYAGIVIIENTDREYVFPLLVARQDIYQDPQKPVQVEPKVYEIGKVGKDSPVLVTTNFSITYFTVAGEVESSKVPSYIVCCDSEGMSVLTAWAAEKFTAEKISDMLKKCGIEGKLSHRNVIIPGYVSVLSGKLEEVSGWKVSVGPREASGIVGYLRGWKA